MAVSESLKYLSIAMDEWFVSVSVSVSIAASVLSLCEENDNNPFCVLVINVVNDDDDGESEMI